MQDEQSIYASPKERELNILPAEQFGQFSPAIYSQNEDLIKWQLNNIDLVEEIEHKLRGEVYDNVNQCWKNKYSALMNEVGINDLMTFIQAHVGNKNLILTNLREEDVDRIAMECRDGVIDLLFLGFDKYEIDIRHLDMIVKIVDHCIFPILRRSFNEGERKFLRMTERRTEQFVRHDEDANKPKGFIRSIFGG